MFISSWKVLNIYSTGRREAGIHPWWRGTRWMLIPERPLLIVTGLAAGVNQQIYNPGLSWNKIKYHQLSFSSCCSLFLPGDDLMRCVDLYNQTQSKWFEEMVTTSMVNSCVWFMSQNDLNRRVLQNMIPLI